MSDLIDRQAVIVAVKDALLAWSSMPQWRDDKLIEALVGLPSAHPEQTDCEYCHEDSDGYVRPIEKNSHAWLIRRGRTVKLRVGFKGGYSECDILFCPMCGRGLTEDDLISRQDMIHLQREQAYMQGWEDGRKALREEIWEDGRDRLD